MTAPPKEILHFTLGPVQGFIGDARRTRDFWAGSFLLSWLSGHAMAALDKAGGKIDFPQAVDDELFRAIRHKEITTTPYIGSLPNRFKADVSDVKGDPVKICKKAILDAWEKLECAVWKQFIEGDIASKGKGGAKKTKDIWERQVDNFWDINWVVGAPEFDKKDPSKPIDGKWLDQRKNWRTHLQADEPGDLCRLMGKYQELSGYHRIGGKGEQKTFWDGLASKISALNLRPDERLCAIALIKRLFPVLDNIEEIIGWNPGGNGMDIIHWPSVSYIATVPWLKGVEDTLGNSEQSNYWKNADKNVSGDFMGEYHTKLFGFEKNGLFKLDGHLLHEDGIRAWKADDLNGDDDGEKAGSRKALLDGLKDIQDKVGDKASEFYAVLIMDGDRIGAKIGEFEETVSTGLATFTGAVKDYFDPGTKDNPGNPANGVLIYAGGDDVLAFVPVDTAIEAATFLQEKYMKAFEQATTEHGGYIKDFTMSGALVFAQYKTPLRAVLKKAHHYLDNIAKDKNGRDSLAIAVMKPGGIAYDWVSGWGVPIGALDDIAENKKQYSNSFFYNVRARYAPLFEGDDPAADRETQAVISDDPKFMRSILTAEYKKQFRQKELKGMTEDEIGVAISKLMLIGRPTNGAGDKSPNYHFDGALVARFLSAERRWSLTDKQGGNND